MPELALLALAGVAHAALFSLPDGAPPWLAPVLECALLGLLLARAGRARSAARAAALGFAFGLGWFGAGVWWTYVSLHDHGGLWAWLAALASALLVAALALFPALALGAAHRLTPSKASPWSIAILASAWTLSEWLRAVLLGGFPWIATGIAHVEGPLAGYAPVLGEHGVSFAAAALSAALGFLIAPLHRVDAPGERASPTARLLGRPSGAVIALAILALGMALAQVTWSSPDGAPLRVRLVQGNIPQDLKFGDDGLALSLDAYGRLAGAGADRVAELTILPESAFPLAYGDLPERASRILDGLHEGGGAVLFGAFVTGPGRRIYNSAIGIDSGAGAAPQFYRKSHLVPFGEFIPVGLHWFTALLDIPIGDQDSGELAQAPLVLAGRRVSVNICFEQLFGAERTLAWRFGQGPGLLVNLSNLAWFNDSVALPQFLRISRMRALETARPMLLATNTGPTAILDAGGRVRAQLAPDVAGALDGEAQAMRGDTPFTRLGNAPVLLACAATLAIALAASKGLRDRYLRLRSRNL